jgi:hypothetical protein
VVFAVAAALSALAAIASLLRGAAAPARSGRPAARKMVAVERPGEVRFH